jgi:hypothetical protein
MKKLFLLLAIAFMSSVALAQGMYSGDGMNVKMSTHPNDSLFIEGRYVGMIVEAIQTPGAGTENYTEYKIILDEFPLNSLKDKIATSLKAHNQQITYVERFKGKTKNQIAGYYLRRAGDLKTGRNNWSIGGAVIVTAGSLIFSPATIVGISALSGVAVITSIVAIVKDYKANKMISKAGNILIE